MLAVVVRPCTSAPDYGLVGAGVLRRGLSPESDPLGLIAKSPDTRSVIFWYPAKSIGACRLNVGADVWQVIQHIDAALLLDES